MLPLVRALIFDCDGVLAETEREAHLPAFNEAFAEVGLPPWSEQEYGERLKTGGGKERLAKLLTPDFVREHGLPADAAAQAEWVARLHARKTKIFNRILESGGVEPRPGVVRLADEALAAGWALAVVSTSAEESVRTVVRRVLGDRPVRVVAGDVVPAKKPDPAIYELALHELGVAPQDAVAVEDSRIGLLAAVRARLACVVAVSSFTSGEEFAEAALVVPHLGDAADPARVTLERLAACLR